MTDEHSLGLPTDAARDSTRIASADTALLTTYAMTTEEEAKYFKQKELALRDAKRRELERAAKEAAERRTVAGILSTEDDAVVERIRELGFDGDTVRVLDLLPLIHVAWADGNVTQRERASILQLVERRGIVPGDEAFLLVEALLEQQPSEDFLDETLHLLRDIGGGRESDILQLCLKVADASGGFFGIGDRISDEERALIQHIADELGETAQSTFRDKL